MKKLSIEDLRKKCYRDLSGGQQQRVLLARALCATGKMLLLDEPVAGLDPKVTGEMYELIEQLNKEGITILMVSHDMAAAVQYATHILHIGQEPLFFGKKEDYLKLTKFRTIGELDTSKLIEDRMSGFLTIFLDSDFLFDPSN